MKVRSGFVSNSSTSSFCILGCPLTDEIMERLRQRAKEAYGDGLKDYSVIFKLGLSRHRDDDDEEVIGFSIDGDTPEDLIEAEKVLRDMMGEDAHFTIICGEDSN